MAKTGYTSIIKDLITSLVELRQEDLGDPAIRHKCASAMYNAYYQISDSSEKELAYKIMNYGGDLEGETVLDIDHPMYDQDLKDFGNSINQIILYLQEIKSRK